MTDNLFSDQNSSSILNPDDKVGQINKDLNWVLTQKNLDYLPAVRGLVNHKSVSVRRKVVEIIGSLGNKEDIDFLLNHKKGESDRETFLKIESAVDRLERKIDGGVDGESIDVLTVSEALGYIKNLVSEREFTIKGEISESNTYGSMYFFKLKDGRETVMDCWCFAGIVMRAGFPLNEGLEIKVTGKFKISNKSSRLIFDVKRLELTGEGEFLRNLKLLEQKLRDEGLMDESRKRRPVLLPRKVLLIASPNSAAITDFLKVVNNRRKGLEIYHLPVKTQGRSAENVILNALAGVNNIVTDNDIDTIVLTRGGGSKEDLIVFNSEKVVRALHGLSRPTIVAIGHERDTTLAELVADRRAATPSQAAEFSSLSSSEVDSQMGRTIQMLKNLFIQRKNQYQEFVDSSTKKDDLLIRNRISDGLQLARGIDATLHRVFYEASNQTQLSWNRIYNLVQIKLNNTQRDLQVIGLQLETVNPKKIMERGFGLIKQKDSYVSKVGEIDKSGELELQMIDGQIQLKPIQ